MRRVFLALAVGLSSLAFAGEPGGMPEPAEAAARMAEHLGLDEATQSTVEALLAEARGRAEPLVAKLKEAHTALEEERAREDSSMKRVRRIVHDIADLKADLFLIRLETGDEIEAQLSPEQAQRFRAFRESAMRRGGHRRGGSEAPPDAFFDL